MVLGTHVQIHSNPGVSVSNTFFNPCASQHSLQNCKELHCKGPGELLSQPSTGQFCSATPLQGAVPSYMLLRIVFCFLSSFMKNSKTKRHHALKEKRQLLTERMNLK